MRAVAGYLDVVYGAQAAGGAYEHFNNDGTFSPIPNLEALGVFDNFGMWGDPVNGDIISNSTRLGRNRSLCGNSPCD